MLCLFLQGVAAAQAHTPAEFAQMAAQLRLELAKTPDDTALHAQLGEVLTLAAGGTVTSAALAEFARVPDDPRSRFYRAVAVAQGGDTAAALVQLRALAAEAPQDAPWRQLVLDEIQALTAPPADPAASNMDEVRDFLHGLDTGAAPAHPPAPPAASPAALRDAVRATPSDPAAWLALARAYAAAGDTAQAADTLRQANQAIAGNMDLLLAYADQLAPGIQGDALPAPFLEVMRQVNAIDPHQPDALWYLGVDAARRGDAHRARKLWQSLLDELPAGSAERASVQRRLDALR